MILEEKNRSWEKKCSEIEMYLGGTRSSEAWKFIKTLRNENTQRTTLPLISIKAWEDHYKKELTEDRQEYLVQSPVPYQIEGQPITVSTKLVEKAVNNMKNKKAPGPEGIPAELLKCNSKKLNKMLAYLFERYLNGDCVPEN